MMEETQIGVRHDNAVLVTGGNDARIIGGAGRTAYVGDAAL